MWSYPVLDPVSQAYPRAEGRSPTCYSPVRRSCTPERALPLDLHVLSTPPAFVLSQDQTLQQNLALAKPATGSQVKQTGIKPIHDKARHTVEFSRDTRTPCDPCGSGRGNFHTVRGPGRGVKLRQAHSFRLAPWCSAFRGGRRIRGLTLGRRSVPVCRAAR